MFVGIPSSGGAGLINLISSFAGGHIAAGVVCTVATVGWALETMAFVWMLKNVRAHSSGEQGHTLAQAKQEIQMCASVGPLVPRSLPPLPVPVAHLSTHTLTPLSLPLARAQTASRPTSSRPRPCRPRRSSSRARRSSLARARARLGRRRVREQEQEQEQDSGGGTTRTSEDEFLFCATP